MKKILVVLVGILFVGIGIIVWLNENAKVKKCTVETVGTIVEIKEEISKNRDDDYNDKYKYTYYPVIRYRAGERTITKQSSSGSSSNSKISIGGAITLSSTHSKYRVNDSIDILYNPDNVEEFIIKGDKTTNFIVIICIILGVLTTIVGVILL